ncbi:T3SS (YopN, CesT) and YbjN peptide-binding chaperone 1 [Actinomycetes bacterium M1A6_2h]
MTDVDDFDRSVALAWRGCLSALGDHIAEMRDGDSLLLVAVTDDPDEVSAPCVQVYAWDDEGNDLVRCEVLSNHYLAADRQLTPSDEAALRSLGFADPVVGPESTSEEPSNWFLDRPRSFADEVAAAAVAVVRDVFFVPHPAFLGSESTGVEFAVSDPPPRPSLDLRAAVTIVSPDHRRSLIDDTLEHMLGFVPPVDDDGDIPLRLGAAWIYLCPMDDAPFVQILAPIAAAVPDVRGAAAVIADINARWPHVKLLLQDDRVVATIELTVIPFVPQHLLDMLAVMERFVSEAARDVVVELDAVPYIDALGNVTSLADDDDATVLPVELRALVELVWQHGDSVDVDDVLILGDRDRPTIARYIDLAREQVRAAGERAESSNDRRAVRAAYEDLFVWDVTVDLLTSAHRRLVGEVHTRDVPGGQLELFRNPGENTLFD